MPLGIPIGLGASSIGDSGGRRLVDDCGSSDNGIGEMTGCQISTFQPMRQSLCGRTFTMKSRIGGPRSTHKLATRMQLI
jgi:hypothetical protein